MLMRKSGQIQTSVLISREFYDLCKEYNIRFSEAMRVGISLLLAEKDLRPYDNRLNLFRKLQLVRAKLEETSQELEKFKSKYNSGLYEKNDSDV